MPRKSANLKEEKKNFFARIIAAVFFVLMVFGGAFLLWQNSHTKVEAETNLVNNQEENKKVEEVADLIAKVSKHIVLPSGEEPTIATIVDADKLRKDQAFYKDVQNGDKVLIYLKAQKAIIYRESEDKLINVGPVYTNKTVDKKIEKKSEKENSIAQSSEPLKIEIRNGSGKAGVAGKLRDKLNPKDFYDVIDIGDASKYYDVDYMIIDLTKGNKEKQLEELKKDLGIQNIVKELPEGEKKTDAEVLIIIGKNS